MLLKRIKEYSINSKVGIITNLELVLKTGVTLKFYKQNSFYIFTYPLYLVNLKSLDKELLKLENRDELINFMLDSYDSTVTRMN